MSSRDRSADSTANRGEAVKDHTPPSTKPVTKRLDDEEYIEQAYFFRVFGQRLDDNRPAQDILRTVAEEILATTKLPIAIEYLASECERRGLIAPAMSKLAHYFAPFQTFVISRAEDDRSKLPFRTALSVLQAEAEYRAGLHEADRTGRRDVEVAGPTGLFTFHFEAIARNRLGYTEGLAAMAADPIYFQPDPRDGQERGAEWQAWLLSLPHRIGTVDFGELVYGRSEQYVDDYRRQIGDSGWMPPLPTLFGLQEGRIAKANRGRDPLYMFAALQRQLGYPKVPRVERKNREEQLDPALELRFQRLEAKLAMLENEQRGTLDLADFMNKGEPKFED